MVRPAAVAATGTAVRPEVDVGRSDGPIVARAAVVIVADPDRRRRHGDRKGVRLAMRRAGVSHPNLRHLWCWRR